MSTTGTIASTPVATLTPAPAPTPGAVPARPTILRWIIGGVLVVAGVLLALFEHALRVAETQLAFCIIIV